MSYRPTEQVSAETEDALFLLEWGEHPAHIAKRIGISLATLSRRLRRSGIYDPSIENELQRCRRKAAS